MGIKVLKVRVSAEQEVSALLQVPPGARACYVMAHGAGAGMTHGFMTAFAEGLTDRRIATLRYQFPFMENGSRRSDNPSTAHATVGRQLPRARDCCRTCLCSRAASPLEAG